MRRHLALVLIASAFLTLPLAAQRPRGGEIRVERFPSSILNSPRVGMAPNGDFVVVWQTGHIEVPTEPSRIWLRLFRADGKPKTKQLRVTNTTSGEMWPRLAMAADGSFLVVWQSGSQDDTSVFGRRFNANGVPRGDRFRLSSSTQGSQEQPATAFAQDGSFVATWVSHGHDVESPWDVFARRFDATGQPLGPDFFVNAQSSEVQDSPQVALSATGDFLIGWVSWVGEGGFYDVLARRFALDGTPQSDEIRLNDEENAAASQDELALGVREDGSFVALWTDRAVPPESSLGGQRFTASGDPVGRPLQVTRPPGGSEDQPAIAMTADGGFFATWVTDGSVPNSTAIIGRKFASDGTPRSGEIRLDSPSDGVKGAPAVALNSDGRGVVVWLKRRSNAGVFVRRLAP